MPHPPHRVWRVLTDPELLARWLMPNDFALEVGRRFTFRGEAIPAVRFGGTVHCEVLAYEVERMLRISWDDPGDDNRLRSTVTWRLEPEGRGTRLFLAHDGFDEHNPVHRLSRRILGGGWVGVLRKLGAVVDQAAGGEHRNMR
ncbi:SRPBCC domain-containing protein [Saccharothrix sp. SC076]|nr:SRPBCC domain-containing protein [Saccharothrix obliqua]